MNYDKSEKILNHIKKSKNILLNCHRGPDPDAIGSALALDGVLSKMKKNVDIVCPSKLDSRLKFLKNYDKIQGEVDFNNFDYSRYDLFIVLDSSSWDMVVNGSNIKMPDIPVIKIDHHVTNRKYGLINLVDIKISSVGELLYSIFEDWGINYGKDVATALLAAIIGDTGVFRYTNTSARTLQIAGNLLSKGADKNEIVYQIYRSIDITNLLFAGEVLKGLEVDSKHKFVWVSIPYKIFKKYGKPEEGKEIASNNFAQTVKGTNFGFIILEIEKRKYSISFRSRNDKTDVSKLATTLGGGGHKVAAGGGSTLEGEKFDVAVETVLRAARKFAKQYV